MGVERTRDEILEAAGEVFAERGYRDGTVREICRMAGANIAAVNYYFGDKQRLYLAAVQRAYQLRSQQVPMPHWPPSTPPREKLRSFITTLMQRMVGQTHVPWTVRLMLREVFQPTEACRALVEDYFRPQFERLLGILAELLPPDVPEDRRHKLAFSIVGQCFFYRAASEVIPLLLDPVEREAHFSVRQLADHVFEMTCAGLDRVPEHWRVAHAET